MLYLLYGDDRVAMLDYAQKKLGEGHEVIEGEGVDMVNVFLGGSLFDEKRRIMIKDLGENKGAWESLPKYLGTENEVVLVESRVDKRGVVWKELAAGGAEVREFRLVEAPEKKLVFDVLDTAMRGEGKRAVEMVERVEMAQDAYMFFGLLVSQAIRKLEMGDRRARRVISLLAKTDVLMKSSATEPWVLVKRVLVLIASGR